MIISLTPIELNRILARHFNSRVKYPQFIGTVERVHGVPLSVDEIRLEVDVPAPVVKEDV